MRSRRIKYYCLLISLFAAGLLSFTGCARQSKREAGILKNGLQFVFLDSEASLTSAVYLIHTGEIDGKPGHAGITADLLLRGTRVRTAGQIYAEIEKKGGYIQSESSLLYTTVFTEAPSENFYDCFEILTEAVAMPSFDEDPVQYRIRRAKQRVGALGKEKPFRDDSMIRGMLFEGSPFARPVPQKPVRFTGSEIRKHYQTFFKPSNMVLAVSGKIDKRRIMQTLSKHWDLTEKAEPAVREVEKGRRSASSRRIIRSKEKNSRVILGFNAPDALSEEGITGAVMEYLLTHGRTGYLNMFLEDKGWADRSVDAAYYDAPELGYFVVTLNVEGGREEEGSDLIQDALKSLGEKVTEEAAETAKQKFLTSYYSSLQHSLRSAILLAFMQQSESGFTSFTDIGSNINNVSANDLRKYAADYLQNPVIVIMKQ